MPTSETAYEPLRLENQLCFPLYACAKEIIRQYRKPLEPLDLTYTQYIVMMVLWEFGGMTEGELGKKIRLDSGTLTPLLKRLEKQGLIERIRPEHNERKLFLKLTQVGEALKQKAIAVPCAMQNCIQMPKEELLLLRKLLNKALHSMEMRESEHGSEL
jgi:DNA-binding MarR family transcriptional regulator